MVIKDATLLLGDRDRLFLASSKCTSAPKIRHNCRNAGGVQGRIERRDEVTWCNNLRKRSAQRIGRNTVLALILSGETSRMETASRAIRGAAALPEVQER